MAKDGTCCAPMFPYPPAVGVTLMGVDPRPSAPIVVLAKGDKEGGDRGFEGFPPRVPVTGPWKNLRKEK